ncbi:uncharacterized protein [Fopius arisanus]|uniref:Uncharacterized protein n=1 Tax=Fopius arisanus TaxID=64838 RepID=A0A9R1SW74_9HYME|nr:PREDICTED: uncharacterized protein LOC105263641 [Fopius arisanus]
MVHGSVRRPWWWVIPTADLADILTISHAFRMLSCRDGIIAGVARGSLWEAVQRRTGHNPSPEEVGRYLSGSREDPFGTNFGGDPGFWATVRAATQRQSHRLEASWHPGPNNDLEIRCRGREGRPVIIPQASDNQGAQEYYLASLLGKPDQGKVSHLSAHSGMGNAFVRDGKFTRFADWRFIHRARLGVLPLNGTMRWRNGDKRCRRCGYSSETIPHVLLLLHVF